MFSRKILYAGMVGWLVLLLSGCSSISPEELAKLATVEGGDGHTLASVDNKMTALFASSVNVAPGEHTFEMTLGCYNNQCTNQTYRFNAEAGYLYRLMPNRTIFVLDRSDRYQRKVDELTPIRGSGTDYVTRNQNRQYAQEAARQAQAARAALIERRRQNLQQVRNVGARICLVEGQFRYIGFVEDFTDEKVKIRVAEERTNDAYNYVVTNFTPKIVWDSPLNWDLCE